MRVRVSPFAPELIVKIPFKYSLYWLLKSNVTIEFGWFWDVLVFQLGSEIFRIGGVGKAQSKQLQTLFNHLTLWHVKGYYQKIEPRFSITNKFQWKPLE